MTTLTDGGAEETDGNDDDVAGVRSHFLPATCRLQSIGARSSPSSETSDIPRSNRSRLAS